MSLHDAPSSSDDNDVVVLGRDDVSNYNPDNILPESSETIAEIRKWLRPTEYNLDGSEYLKHLASHLANTGEWLPRLDGYKTWHDSPDHGLLWIRGVPGSGKSVIAATLAHRLSQEDVPVLFFFFRQIIDANHRPINLLRDWLDQILLYSPPLQSTLKEYIDTDRSVDSVSMDELWRHLRMAMASIPLTYCVVDALDEMDQYNDDFVRSLADLGHWRPSTVKVLMTSRPVVSVETPMRGIGCIDIRMEESLIDIDIAAYVRHCLDGTSISEDDRYRIKQAVPGRANGLFLYAKLAMKAFLEPNVNVSTALEMLPLDMEAMYVDLLQEHARRSRISETTQVLILRWVTHATRPLRLLELADMLKYVLGGESTTLKDNKDLVRAACGPLLEILPDETVSVVHHSLTEFLVGTKRPVHSAAYPVLDSISSHSQLAEVCLGYLRSGCLQCMPPAGSASERFSVNHMNLNFPFAEYAADNWYMHAARSKWNGMPGDPISQQLEPFLSDATARNRWLRMCLDESQGILDDDYLESFSDLHVAAICGLDSYLKTLIGQKTQDMIDLGDIEGRTPLWWAADRGHAESVRVLSQAGAALNRPDNAGYKPLHKAATFDRFEVVKLLLETGVDPLTPRQLNENSCGTWPVPHAPLTAFEIACKHGQLKSLEAFLPFIDTDTKQTALSWAAGSGQSHILKRLLKEPGIDPNAKHMNETPLASAAIKGSVDSMELLIEAGADASIRSKARHWDEPMIADPDDLWRTPLAEFCRRQYQTVPRTIVYQRHFRRRYPRDRRRTDEFRRGLSLLVRAGADVNERDSLGHAAIHVTIDPEAVKVLLDAGADPKAETPYGETALHFLPSEADEDYLKLLVEEGGVDINKREFRDGRTPLTIAIWRDSDLALRILEYNPDCNAVDATGNGPLHYAASYYGKPSVDGGDLYEADEPGENDRLPTLLKALLEAGADPNLANNEGETPLHLLNERSLLRHPELLELLIKFGASTEHRDFMGFTPLFRQIAKGRDHMEQCQLVKLFKKASANLHALDSRGRTLLHEAIRNADRYGRQHSNSTLAFQELIDAGVSPFIMDFQGNTLCHELVNGPNPKCTMEISSSFWPLLESLGLDTEQANFKGRTPLHLACMRHFPEREKWPGHGRRCFEWLLDHSSDPNVQDRQGVRPIHIAASTTECAVDRLIRAGADPFASTRQGMNALHIASRCRLSNTVGLLLERMKDLDPEAMLKAVNAKDTRQLTPLHYASRSGRIESVSLLLEAGADVNPTFDASLHLEHWEPWYPPVLQCVFFKQENALWKRDAPPRGLQRPANLMSVRGGRNAGNPNMPVAVAFTIEDTNRPQSKPVFPDARSEIFDPVLGIVRYDEIVRTLLAAGANMYDDTHWEGSALYSAMRFAAREWDDYVVNLLWTCHEEFRGPELPRPTKVSVTTSRARRQIDTKLLGEAILPCAKEATWEAIEQLLGDREYSLIPKLYEAGADFISGDDAGVSVLLEFTRLGFAQLVDDCCSLEEALRFDDGKWRREQEDAASKNGVELTPLAITACERVAPNMDVLRVLVEKKGVDIDAPNDHARVGGRALHVVAQGSSWWQIAQAMPYLVSKGADLEARDWKGSTPLHCALEKDNLFNLAAAKTLIGLGADVNAVDSTGEGCLEKAAHDVELVRLLVSHGVGVSPAAISSAAKNRDLGVLKALLSSENMPALAKCWNLGLKDIEGLDPSEAKARIARQGHPLAIAGRMLPLRRVSEDIDVSETRAKELMEALLAAGVSPYDTFLVETDSRVRYTRPSLVTYVARDKWKTEDKVFEEIPYAEESEDGFEPAHLADRLVFHQLLAERGVYEPILGLPGLDLERRNASGQTPLLAACRGGWETWYISNKTQQKSVVKELLDRGADPTVVDDFGRNMLHHCLGSNVSNEGMVKWLQELGDVVPALVNQPDSSGYYPLHHRLAAIVEVARYGPSDYEWLDYFISQGADVTVTDGDGNNALHYLASGLESYMYTSGNGQGLFKRFVELGLDVNARNKIGKTPVFSLRSMSCPVGQESKALKMLDEMGVDWQVRDEKGRTVLHEMAEEDGGLFKSIMDRGVDPLLEDIDGRTSLDLATAYGNVRVKRLFDNKNGEDEED
ncbi:hypothetical protein ACHAPT_012960 [Fusarium lateritium]